MNIRNVLTILALMIVVTACLTNGRKESMRTTTAPQDDASELALLMRAMASHADSVKAAIARNDKLPPKLDLARLLTASPTPGMHIDPITYPTFAADQFRQMEALYKAPRKERPQAYNALIQSCANCHGVHCPGPLMRIKKMYVNL